MSGKWHEAVDNPVPKPVLAKLGNPKALRYVIDGDHVTVSGITRKSK